MAEINNWIKEQLKKGYKKEQIRIKIKGNGLSKDKPLPFIWDKNKKYFRKFAGI